MVKSVYIRGEMGRSYPNVVTHALSIQLLYVTTQSIWISLILGHFETPEVGVGSLQCIVIHCLG